LTRIWPSIQNNPHLAVSPLLPHLHLRPYVRDASYE